jgi:predicted ATPase
MLKRLTVKNFKAIQDMTIEFTPLTVLIGGNGCGKSTVLQALDLLRSAATRDISEYLRERGWTFEELKSKLSDEKDRPVEFVSEYQFDIEGNIRTVRWDFAVDLKKSIDWIINEKIEIINDETEPRILMRHGPGYGEAIPAEFGKFDFQSSILKYYKAREEDREILALKQFLASSTYYGLLSPDTIRAGQKTGITGTIGNGGEWLAAFIHGLDDDGREKLNRMVSDFIGIKVAVTVFDAGSAFLLISREQYETKEIAVDAWHTSDGLLRIIAFAAMRLERLILRLGASDGAIQIKLNGDFDLRGYVERNNGMMLLDEIEDGINPYLTEKAVALLRDTVEQSDRQVIITTHSPVVLNDINPDYINLLWKDKSGSVYCRKLFSISELHDSLDFLSPGDAWMNIREEDLLAKAGSEPEGKE